MKKFYYILMVAICTISFYTLSHHTETNNDTSMKCTLGLLVVPNNFYMGE